MAEKWIGYAICKYAGNRKNVILILFHRTSEAQKTNTYRKSMRSAISDASTGIDGCEFLPNTSTITLKSNERVWKICVKNIKDKKSSILQYIWPQYTLIATIFKII